MLKARTSEIWHRAGGSMPKWFRRFALGVSAVALCAGVALGTGTARARAVHGQAFANFRVAMDPGIDSLDPALAYAPESWSIIWNTYLPLLGYKHASGRAGTAVVPYLAQALPTVSADRRTYALTLRRGLEYSDGSVVK